MAEFSLFDAWVVTETFDNFMRPGTYQCDVAFFITHEEVISYISKIKSERRIQADIKQGVVNMRTGEKYLLGQQFRWHGEF